MEEYQNRFNVKNVVNKGMNWYLLQIASCLAKVFVSGELTIFYTSTYKYVKGNKKRNKQKKSLYTVKLDRWIDWEYKSSMKVFNYLKMCLINSLSYTWQHEILQYNEVHCVYVAY